MVKRTFYFFFSFLRIQFDCSVDAMSDIVHDAETTYDVRLLLTARGYSFGNMGDAREMKIAVGHSYLRKDFLVLLAAIDGRLYPPHRALCQIMQQPNIKIGH